MRTAILFSFALLAAPGNQVIAGGIRVALPPGWMQATAANDGPVTDPRTLLVVGTAGVRPRLSGCQIAAYRIPAAGAAVVIVGWRSRSGGGPDRTELAELRAVRRPSFECFSGRGAVAQVVLAGKRFQVNVMVGDKASPQRVAEALSVARSFDLAR